MCTRGKLFKVPADIVKRDLLMLVECMNEKNPEDMITLKNINNAFDGYFSEIKYTNDKITEITGIPFEKTQKETRADDKLASTEEEVLMHKIVEREYSKNPKISLRNLSAALELHGIERKKRFLSTNPDVVAIRNKHRV
jgi:hypothetical protein